MRLCAYEEIGLFMLRLEELADADAEGRVVVLPCDDGDIVFVVALDCDQTFEEECIKCAMESCDDGCNKKDHLVIRMCGVDVIGLRQQDGKHIAAPMQVIGCESEWIEGYDGKYYFTRAEAEVALEEMKGGGHSDQV